VDQWIRRLTQNLVLKTQIPQLALDSAKLGTHLGDNGTQIDISGCELRANRSTAHARTLS
jgi:hypothetical protein